MCCGDEQSEEFGRNATQPVTAPLIGSCVVPQRLARATMSRRSMTWKETKNASSSARCQSRPRSAPHAKRPEAECRAGSFWRAECPARRHVRSVSEDEELSLAHVWSAFSRLSSSARRARRPALPHCRSNRRTRSQDRWHDLALDRPHRPLATRGGQRFGFCYVNVHAC